MGNLCLDLEHYCDVYLLMSGVLVAPLSLLLSFSLFPFSSLVLGLGFLLWVLGFGSFSSVFDSARTRSDTWQREDRALWRVLETNLYCSHRLEKL